MERPTLPVTSDLDLHQLGHSRNQVGSPRLSRDCLERRVCVNQLEPGRLRDGGDVPRRQPRVFTADRNAAAFGRTAAHPAATSGPQLQRGEEEEGGGGGGRGGGCARKNAYDPKHKNTRSAPGTGGDASRRDRSDPIRSPSDSIDKTGLHEPLVPVLRNNSHRCTFLSPLLNTWTCQSVSLSG